MMTVKHIVQTAAELVGVGEAVRTYLDGGDSAQGAQAVEALLGCYQRVETELAVDYFPIVCEEKVEVRGGRLEYASLARRAARVTALLDEGGRRLPMRLFATYLAAEDGTYTLRYAALPAEKTVGEAVECGFGVSEGLMAYGVAAEYCLTQGLHEEHAAWRKKYRSAVAETYRLRGGKRMRTSEWV